jgi:hypothetical protein
MSLLKRVLGLFRRTQKKEFREKPWEISEFAVDP